LNKWLERGEDRVWWCLGTGCWREEKRGCDVVWKQDAGERREQSVTVVGTRCWREERAEFDGGWEEDGGYRRGQNVAVFGNRVLERGEEKL